MTPRLGMHFDDLDEAYNFYNAYGKLAGFSIRKESSNRGKDGEVVWKRLVCSKEGKTDEKHWIGKELVQRRRMETRFDCKAKLQVKLDKSGGYVVSMFVPQHSHAPATPTSHWPLLMEVEKALMKTCNDLQCSMTIMQRRCHLLQCLAHRDCHHEYCYAHLLFEGKGYKGYGISYVGSGAINLANQYDTDAGSFFVKTNMSVQCFDCQMLEL
ncbi:hypothetical protein MRB53_013192 [Persea americana]|uniref:Uncharacterized protein n=1 Tax=Persea americana TaxID=3435 RepID=A0ACC2K7E1_PERAE|nr:hypothetical protein MRB53_013192 [Persea americana]